MPGAKTTRKPANGASKATALPKAKSKKTNKQAETQNNLLEDSSGVENVVVQAEIHNGTENTTKVTENQNQASKVNTKKPSKAKAAPKKTDKTNTPSGEDSEAEVPLVVNGTKKPVKRKAVASKTDTKKSKPAPSKERQPRKVAKSNTDEIDVYAPGPSGVKKNTKSKAVPVEPEDSSSSSDEDVTASEVRKTKGKAAQKKPKIAAKAKGKTTKAAVASKKEDPLTHKSGPDMVDLEEIDSEGDGSKKPHAKSKFQNSEEIDPPTRQSPKGRKRKGGAAPATNEKLEEPEKKSSKRPAPESKATATAKSEVKSRAKISKKVFMEVPKMPTVSGVVFVMGNNDVGQLGFSSEECHQKKRPTLLELEDNVVDIAAGGMHSMCLTDKGEVYTFGCNDEGALGRRTDVEQKSKSSPEEDEPPNEEQRALEIHTDVEQESENDELPNKEEKPTDAEVISEYTPQKIKFLTEKGDIEKVIIVRISAGDSHSAALSDKGQVYAWGNFRNNNGPIGLGTSDSKQVVPVRMLEGITVVSITSGSDHLVCLTNEGLVYTCGDGLSGQLGRVAARAANGGRRGFNNLVKPDIVHIGRRSAPSVPMDSVFTGITSTFLRAKGSNHIYAFGLNNFNQLGFPGNDLTRFTPTHNTAFSAESSYQHICGGPQHTLALDNEGVVYSIGRKEYGRLGLGEDSDDANVPTVVPTLQNVKTVGISSNASVSFSVSDKGSAYSWGMGSFQLGHRNEDDCWTPREIVSPTLEGWHIIKVASGGQHTLLMAKKS